MFLDVFEARRLAIVLIICPDAGSAVVIVGSKFPKSFAVQPWQRLIRLSFVVVHVYDIRCRRRPVDVDANGNAESSASSNHTRRLPRSFVFGRYPHLIHHAAGSFMVRVAGRLQHASRSAGRPLLAASSFFPRRWPYAFGIDRRNCLVGWRIRIRRRSAWLRASGRWRFPTWIGRGGHDAGSGRCWWTHSSSSTGSQRTAPPMRRPSDPGGSRRVR